MVKGADLHSHTILNIVLRDGLADEEVCFPRVYCVEWQAGGKLYCLS